MIIWYRTLTGFEGNLASIARQQTSAEAQAWLDGQDDPGQAYITLDERLIDPALLADLVVNPAAYTVQDGTLHKNGLPVDIGYTSDPVAALINMRDNPIIVGLLTMTDAELRTWINARSTTDVFVMVRKVLASMARATGISRR